MLTLHGRPHRFCDGLSRRSFLEIGGLAVGGLTLPGLLRADAVARRRSHKSVIMVYLPGGPSHLDLYDLKPQAPVEIRGEYNPIATRVPGIEICEHLPRMARADDVWAQAWSEPESGSDLASLQARGVPAYVYKGLGFFDADEVKDLVALMRYLADPGSDLRAAAWLRS